MTSRNYFQQEMEILSSPLDSGLAMWLALTNRTVQKCCHMRGLEVALCSYRAQLPYGKEASAILQHRKRLWRKVPSDEQMKAWRGNEVSQTTGNTKAQDMWEKLSYSTPTITPSPSPPAKWMQPHKRSTRPAYASLSLPRESQELANRCCFKPLSLEGGYCITREKQNNISLSIFLIIKLRIHWVRSMETSYNGISEKLAWGNEKVA